MMFVRRLPDENYVHWFRRWSNIVKACYYKNGGITLSERVAQSILTEARKCAKPGITNSQKLLHQTQKWLNNENWISLQAVVTALDHGNKTSWRHPTCGVRPSQWEDVLIHAFGVHWQESVLDKAVTLKEKKNLFQTDAFDMIQIDDPAIVRECKSQKGLQNTDLSSGRN